MLEHTEVKENEDELKIKTWVPVLTYGIIAINVLIWLFINVIAMTSGLPYDNLLLVFGAKENYRIIMGEYWRFLSPVLLHLNFMHLAVNCYSLYILGTVVERIFGRFRFVAVYVIAGIMGNIVSFMFSTNPGVGASGSIFGLLGTLLFFGLEKPHLFKQYFGKSILITLIINLSFGLATPGIDNYAHMGGLIGGFLASGIVSVVSVNRWYLNRFFYILLTGTMIISGLFYGFTAKQNSIYVQLNELLKYDKAKDWANVEKKAEQLLLELDNTDIVNRSEVLWMLARAEALSNKFDEAVLHAHILTEIDPPDGHYLLGLLYYDMEQFHLSQRELNEAKKAGAAYKQIDEILEDIELRLGQ